MTDLKKTITKGALGTVAAGAMALASATPAMADNHRYRDRGGVDAGDVIAGAVIIGGIAALAGAFDGDNDRRYRDNRYDNRYDNRANYHNNRGYRGDGQRAVERCINAAERQAQRFGGWRYANVTEIRDIDRTRYGFRVQGRLEVQGSRNYGSRNFDRGRFTCHFDGRGRPQIDFDNINGLR
ncbi:hypothetical protein [Qipengyuania sp. ASV99]|uniref:hypothetical protein n=1 Tax=Qipengyuania sp. ASV99 TaxID=3399681 RepID=UPI003A4C5EE3